MAPFIVLVGSYLLLRLAGLLGWSYMDAWQPPLQAAVALMFLLTASAHWGRRRADLIRMVPRSLPSPGGLVTLTGVLELVGAAAILIPALSQAASLGLALMLIAMFPANIRAAREKLTLDGKPVPSLPVRTALQVIFVAAVLLAGC